ncbi:MAG: aminopeptidase P N-terminal domain-containing protein, partial [Candidatus Cloacimonetes bacterium]|nr:aminopeptidase P N-terminal domain-containing protein [Candidatus Cloacimonadota bacterium]
MKPEIVSPRREKLLSSLQDMDAVILFAAREAKLEKFSQENNFLYLTGLETPNAIYFGINSNHSNVEYLFIQRSDPEREVWEGKKTTPEEAKAQSGITNVVFLDEFDGIISNWCPAINRIRPLNNTPAEPVRVNPCQFYAIFSRNLSFLPKFAIYSPQNASN